MFYSHIFCFHAGLTFHVLLVINQYLAISVVFISVWYCCYINIVFYIKIYLCILFYFCYSTVYMAVLVLFLGYCYIA